MYYSCILRGVQAYKNSYAIQKQIPYEWEEDKIDFIKIQGVSRELTKSISLCSGKVASLELRWVANNFSNIYILIIGFKILGKLNFAFCIPVCQNGDEYWIYIGDIFSFTIMILFLLSFLGILSVPSDILQEEEKCTWEKNIIHENSNKKY